MDRITVHEAAEILNKNHRSLADLLETCKSDVKDEISVSAVTNFIKNTIYTGQFILEGGFCDEVVPCHVCHKPVGVKRAQPHEGIKLGWYDPYAQGGKYVHEECLSKERKQDIAEMEWEGDKD